MSLPVIVAGEAADRFGLGVVTGAYFVALAALVGSALVLAWRLGRATSGAPRHDVVRPADRPGRDAVGGCQDADPGALAATA
jgi:uncharacterized membrane protein YedE/YeeE